ncbi:MAG: histidine triad nucleotide-binding protein [Patescibacteria group bacterium]
MADCIFCQIVTQKIPAQIVYQDENYLAFSDIKPAAPVHLLIIPKKHLELKDFEEGQPDLPVAVVKIAKQLAKDHNIDQSGYRLVINNGKDAGQEVAHLHWHLLGGQRLGPIT